MAERTAYKNFWQQENLGRISLTVPKGRKEAIRVHAARHKESLNSFISRAITEAIKRDCDNEAQEEQVLRT